jgi:hypothetical protein
VNSERSHSGSIEAKLTTWRVLAPVVEGRLTSQTVRPTDAPIRWLWAVLVVRDGDLSRSSPVIAADAETGEWLGWFGRAGDPMGSSPEEDRQEQRRARAPDHAPRLGGWLTGRDGVDRCARGVCRRRSRSPPSSPTRPSGRTPADKAPNTPHGAQAA